MNDTSKRVAFDLIAQIEGIAGFESINKTVSTSI